MNDEQRHQLRIAFKKLRYALEFFAPILPRKPLQAYLAVLANIQDLLGQFNDLAEATQRIASLTRQNELPPLIRGWFAGRTHLLVQLLDEEVYRFLKLSAPWSSAGSRPTRTTQKSAKR